MPLRAACVWGEEKEEIKEGGRGMGKEMGICINEGEQKNKRKSM
jgi:hypothetical protein